MKKFGLWITILLPVWLQAAPVYECIDVQGRRTYSEHQGPRCKVTDLKGIGFYNQSADSNNRQQSNVDNTSIEAAQGQQSEHQGAVLTLGTDLEAAQRAVQIAKRNLEEGKKVRYGHERNYARYLERIAALEKAVAESEAKLNALNHGSSDLVR